MRAKTLVPLVLALGLAATLLPLRPAGAFSLIGFGLPLGQRDFRIFNNFADASANNNSTPDSSFPGYFGATLAIWKGHIEWGSELHGDGSGDPHQPFGLGSGGANFDGSFQGEANTVGGFNENIVSAITSCTGALAFTEAPGTSGWRIRFCDNFTWSDGPGTSISGFDLQAVAVHEYGHALGMGHSGTGAATMTPGIAPGSVGPRSIHPDDIAGVQTIYGVRDPGKPRITNVIPGQTLITVEGVNFGATLNEVWFTRKGSGGNGQPVKVTDVASFENGTKIIVAVPSNAGPGDVLVRRDGNDFDDLSNAFPVEPGTGIDPPPPPPPPSTAADIATVTPGTLEAVRPIPAGVTLMGTGFKDVSSVVVDGVALLDFPPQFIVVNDTRIEIPNFPLVSKLGPVTIAITDSETTDTIDVQVVANDPPVTDLLNSNPSFLFSAVGAEVVMGGAPLDLHFLLASPQLGQSFLPGILDAGIGNNFSTLVLLGAFGVDPVQGYTRVLFPFPSTVPLGAQVFVQSGVFRVSDPNFPLFMTNIEAGTILL